MAEAEPDALPALTAAEMAAVDRAMFDRSGLGLDLFAVMELAGRAVAAFARERFLGGDVRRKRVAVLAGPGNNGGDGLVAARLLRAWGADPTVHLGVPRGRLQGVPDRQCRTLERLGVPVAAPPEDGESDSAPDLAALGATDLVLDALLGFGLRRAPAGGVARLVRLANAAPAPVLAVDVPSGLDATDGTAHDPCVRADATLTLALPKTGLLLPDAAGLVGELHVADIGVPPAAYAAIGRAVGPVFASRERIRLR